MWYYLFRTTMGLAIKILRFLGILFGMSTFVVICKILSICPPLYRRFIQANAKHSAMAKTGYNLEDYAGSFSKFSTLKIMIYRRIYLDLFYNKAEVNGKAPNPKVLTSDGKNEVMLLDAAVQGRLLVVNFGSCS